MKKINKLTFYLIFTIIFFLLTGCSEVKMGLDISIDELNINYVGKGGDYSIDDDKIPSIENFVIEPYHVKTNSILTLNFYEKKPSEIYIKSWLDETVYEEKKLDKYEYQLPGQEGLYTYKIFIKWNPTTYSSAFFLVEIK